MFHIYVADINFAFACFPLLAAVLSLPYMAYQYRRFGAIPLWKTFCVFSFALYLLCAYYLVILPLPPDHNAVIPYAQTPQMDPYLVLRQLREAAASAGLSFSSKHSWVAFLRNQNVYQAFFNVALTVPFGMFLQYFLRRPLWQTLILGFGLTLFFEFTQISGLYGIYAHPYRLFDVDDLILNTLGAVIGWLVMAPMSLLLPDIQKMNDRARTRGGQYTTFTRRAVSFALDAVASAAVYLLLFKTAGHGSLATVAHYSEAFDLPLALLATGLVFMALPLVLGMRTPGQLVIGLRIVHPDGSRASWYGPIIRYGLFVWVFLLIIPWMAHVYPGSADGLSRGDLLSVVRMCYLLWGVTVAVRAVLSLFKRPFVTLFGLVSDTRIMSSKQAKSMAAQRAGRPAPAPAPQNEARVSPKRKSHRARAAQQQAADPNAVPQPGFAQGYAPDCARPTSEQIDAAWGETDVYQPVGHDPVVNPAPAQPASSALPFDQDASSYRRESAKYHARP